MRHRAPHLSLAPSHASIAMAMLVLASSSFAYGDDWPHWRGPNHDGLSAADQDPPVRWGEDQIKWSVELPGKGHGSPVIAGGQVFVTTADLEAQRQEVLCLDRKSGKLLWQKAAHESGLIKKGNAKATLASNTPAVVGDRVFVNFLNNNRVVTSCLSREDGELLWQTPISKYKVHQGYGSSPIPFEDLILVSADNKGGGAIAALRQEDGKVAWRSERPKKPNYPSPALVKIDGKTRMVMTGCNLVACFDPRTGEKIWEHAGATTECVTTTLSTGKLLFTSGGYPKNHVAAVRADGSGKVVWENKTRVYVPSMLLQNNHLYALGDQGFAVCWNAETGEQKWKQRLGGGGFTATPAKVGDRMYAAAEKGVVSVFTATPDKFELLAENKLGDEIYATPAICDGSIYIRVVDTSGGARKERLVCIGR